MPAIVGLIEVDFSDDFAGAEDCAFSFKVATVAVGVGLVFKDPPAIVAAATVLLELDTPPVLVAAGVALLFDELLATVTAGDALVFKDPVLTIGDGAALDKMDPLATVAAAVAFGTDVTLETVLPLETVAADAALPLADPNAIVAAGVVFTFAPFEKVTFTLVVTVASDGAVANCPGGSAFPGIETAAVVAGHATIAAGVGLVVAAKLTVVECFSPPPANVDIVVHSRPLLKVPAARTFVVATPSFLAADLSVSVFSGGMSGCLLGLISVVGDL